MSDADTEKGKRVLLRKEVTQTQSKADLKARRDLFKAKKSYKTDNEGGFESQEDDSEDEEGKDGKLDKVELEDDQLKKHPKEKDDLWKKNVASMA